MDQLQQLGFLKEIGYGRPKRFARFYVARWSAKTNYLTNRWS
jgi:hypothetical protein